MREFLGLYSLDCTHKWQWDMSKSKGPGIGKASNYQLYGRDVPDTTLPDTGFNRIVIYRILDISNSKQNMYICVSIDLNKTGTGLVVYK